MSFKNNHEPDNVSVLNELRFIVRSFRSLVHQVLLRTGVLVPRLVTDLLAMRSQLQRSGRLLDQGF
jgi:hypothetical protein